MAETSMQEPQTEKNLEAAFAGESPGEEQSTPTLLPWQKKEGYEQTQRCF